MLSFERMAGIAEKPGFHAITSKTNAVNWEKK